MKEDRSKRQALAPNSIKPSQCTSCVNYVGGDIRKGEENCEAFGITPRTYLLNDKECPEYDEK